VQLGNHSYSHDHAVEMLIALIAQWSTLRYEDSWIIAALRASLDSSTELRTINDLNDEQLRDLLQHRSMFVDAAEALQAVTHDRLKRADIQLHHEVWLRRGGNWSEGERLATNLIDSPWALASPAVPGGPPWASGIPLRTVGHVARKAAVPLRLRLGVLAPTSVMPEGRPLSGSLGDPVSYFANTAGPGGFVAHLLVPVRNLVALPGGLLGHAVEEEVVVGLAPARYAAWAVDPLGAGGW